jgi:NADP-dependent 3-hydroxy acid dehydrogenase YdfG
VLFGCGKPLKAPKTIVITGATSGFGEALALHYAKPGVTLALTGRNETRLAEVAKACTGRCVQEAGEAELALTLLLIAAPL